MCQKKCVFLSEADGTTFQVAKVVSRKEFFSPLYPQFTICENKRFLNLLTTCKGTKSRKSWLFVSCANADVL